MSDQNDKRQEQDRAIKDALVAQVWALSDDDIARTARHDGVEAARLRIKALRDEATLRIASKSSDVVVPLEAARKPAATQEVTARRRGAWPLRLVADVEPPLRPQESDTAQPYSTIGGDPELSKD